MDNDPTAAWPPMPEVRTDAGCSFRIDALEARLRTTAEAVRTLLAYHDDDEPLAAGDYARAVLAALEQEGLT